MTDKKEKRKLYEKLGKRVFKTFCANMPLTPENAKAAERAFDCLCDQTDEWLKELTYSRKLADIYRMISEKYRELSDTNLELSESSLKLSDIYREQADWNMKNALIYDEEKYEEDDFCADEPESYDKYKYGDDNSPDCAVDTPEQDSENKDPETSEMRFPPLPAAEEIDFEKKSKYFDSFYSYLRENIKDCDSAHIIIVFADLRDNILGCTSSSYKNFNLFNRSVVSVLVRQINDFTPLNIIVENDFFEQNNCYLHIDVERKNSRKGADNG